MKNLFFICLCLFLLAGCQTETPTNEDTLEKMNEETEEEAKEEMKEETKEETGDETREPKEEIAVSVIEKYYVLSNYDLTHPSYLSEGISFYHSGKTDYVLGYGHQAHAIGVYHLYTVDEEKNTVSKVREMNEDVHFEDINSIRQFENWEEEMISYMTEHLEPIDVTFFSYNSETAEEELVINDRKVLLYPVSVGDNIHYFKQGQGLWAKYFTGDSVIEFYGEPQWTYRSEIE
ncbi:hypothetical protein RJD24_20745 [Bacillaceae bacterium IKA-2]|nr:hypothetical protein RJD24_20745 [Bacillaceae bacterium IKA-2]